MERLDEEVETRLFWFYKSTCEIGTGSSKKKWREPKLQMLQNHLVKHWLAKSLGHFEIGNERILNEK